MSVAVVHSRALAGVDAPGVTVEVHIAGGLPGIHLVGLPDTEVREARDRVRAALAERAIRIPRAQGHGQPRAGGPAEGVGSLRPADRARHSRGHRADPGRRLCRLRVRGRARADRRVARRARRARHGAVRTARRSRVRPAGGLSRRSGARARRHGLRRAHAARRLRALDGSRAAARSGGVRAGCVRGVARPRRRARPGARQARARDRRGRRAFAAACWAARHGQVDACAAAASAACRRSARKSRSRSRRSLRSPGASIPGRLGASVRFARRTTRRAAWRSSAAAATRGPARSRSRTTACCSSTSCRSGIAACSRCCASRSSPASIHISRAARHSTFPAQFQLVAAMNPCPCGWLGDASGRCSLHAGPSDALSRPRVRAARSTASISRSRCRRFPRTSWHR